jgi:hypothetical protein
MLVTVHGTVKLENRNWKFGLHAFVLRNLQTQTEDKVIEVYFVSFFITSNFGASFSTFVPPIKVLPDHI